MKGKSLKLVTVLSLLLVISAYVYADCQSGYDYCVDSNPYEDWEIEGNASKSLAWHGACESFLHGCMGIE